MRLESAFRVLFVVYCLEAGLFLAVVPWTGTWERLALQPPFDLLHSLLVAPWARGLVSGLGLVHLIRAIHDVDLLVARPTRGS